MAEPESTELAVVEPQAPLALFGTSDPLQVIATAARVATALAEVVNERKLYAIVSGKKFPTVEAWTLLGSMLGVFPITEWSRPLLNEDGSVRGYEARVVARTLGGRIVGAGEAMCLRGESKTWHAAAAEFALRSMAQTRATSKALRGPLDFVFKLAGFQPTPAEEMSENSAADANGEIPSGKASPESVSALRQAEAVAKVAATAPANPAAGPQSASAQVNSGGAVAGATMAAPPPSGPRAKRGHVIPAPQGAPSSDQRTGQPGQGEDSPPAPAAIQGPPPAVAVTSAPPLGLLDPEDEEDGREAYLHSLRQQAREAAAVLRQLRVRSENQKNKEAIALGTLAALAIPPATPSPDSDASLAAYIGDIHPGQTLATLAEAELKAVVDKLEELTARVSAKLR